MSSVCGLCWKEEATQLLSEIDEPESKGKINYFLQDAKSRQSKIVNQKFSFHAFLILTGAENVLEKIFFLSK